VAAPLTRCISRPIELRICSAVLVQMKGFGSFVPCLDPVADVGLERLDGAVVVAAADELFLHAAEPSFDLVDPG
jgi:hypothetical protein